MASSTLAEAQATVRLPTSLRRDFRADLRAYWPLWLLVAAGLFFRIHEVHRLPGMHGDEAWYGLQARRLLAGDAVSWRTPTGNVPGIFHLGSLTLLHSIFPPSLLLLRIPSLVSSFVALILAYAMGRRFFGQTAGMAAVVLMACLPLNIAYARLGWDPSHTPLFILATVYAAFAGRKLLCALLFALALTNHPSAVFAAPFVILGFLGFRFERQDWRMPMLDTLKLAALFLVAILLVIQLSPSTTHYVSLAGAISRLIDPAGWAHFVQMFGRLMSGNTSYVYSTGVGLGPLQPMASWAMGVGTVMLITAALMTFRRRVDWPTAGLLAGSIASLALLYLAAGTWVLNPKLERFSYPMVPITILAVAAQLNLIFGERRSAQAVIGLIALPLLAGFWLHYIVPLQDGRYRQAQSFWTGRQDPAKSAFEQISADAGSSGEATIIAEDWWLQGPISYYAIGTPYRVLDARKLRPRGGSPEYAGAYWVTFSGSKLDRQLAARPDARLSWKIPMTNPNDEVRIWREAGR